MRGSHTMVLTADDEVNPAELLNRLRHSVFELFWLAYVGLSSKTLPSGGFGQLRRTRVQSVKSARPEVSIVALFRILSRSLSAHNGRIRPVAHLRQL